MVQYWPEFVSLAIIHFVAVILPGPDFVITVRQSLKYGRLHGAMTALGIGTGLSVHILYTLLGVGALMQASPWVLQVAKLIGAAYLIYIAIQLLKSAGTIELDAENAQADVSSQSLKKAFSLGFLTNATNPKATLFFLAVVTNVVSQGTPLHIQLFYGAWMCSVNALWFICVSLLFSASSSHAWFLNKMNLVEKALAVLLMAFSLRLLIA
ncbi:LysE family translocator [Pseudoalteromonas piscicida]|uniref:LysE family translocator n=1 Tax=Pseudoalteromonas piscicida TaxID=43662 RepID=UPI0027E40F5B|nr:LysE family translocator [Pseudoalteromonas piscicida]WMO16355.1 LysE family translocator [Pseudoalteromonas piscicida]